MKQTKLTMNLDGLDKLVGAMGNDYVARVGVLGSDSARDGDLTNADLAVIHIFGSIKNNIPPRDFLKMPLEMKKKELMKVLDSETAKRALSAGDYEAVFEILGIAAEGIVQQAFSSAGFGQWPALAASTKRAKGSSAPLIDTAELRRAQSSDVIKRSDL
jgi:hypothetical protein